MMKTAENLRAELSNTERSGAGRPYPLALRSEVVAYVGARQRQGVGLVAAARELGVSASSVVRWTSSLGADPAPGFREVMLTRPIEDVSPAAPRLLVVYGPAGLRVEGFDIAAFAELWRRLL